ncbi:MAG: hypothetical protein K6E51_14680 [Treponema sp.]|nr:hypothetical protein [Treponema sp.]
MRDLEWFKQVQEHNHKVMEQVTELENKAFTAISDGNMTEFNELIEQIVELQKSYQYYT